MWADDEVISLGSGHGISWIDFLEFIYGIIFGFHPVFPHLLLGGIFGLYMELGGWHLL